jgi:hypothetical protein
MKKETACHRRNVFLHQPLDFFRQSGRDIELFKLFSSSILPFALDYYNLIMKMQPFHSFHTDSHKIRLEFCGWLRRYIMPLFIDRNV